MSEKERERWEDEEGNEEEHTDKDTDYVQYMTRKSMLLVTTLLLLIMHAVLFFF